MFDLLYDALISGLNIKFISIQVTYTEIILLYVN